LYTTLATLHAYPLFPVYGRSYALDTIRVDGTHADIVLNILFDFRLLVEISIQGVYHQHFSDESCILLGHKKSYSTPTCKILHSQAVCITGNKAVSKINSEP